MSFLKLTELQNTFCYYIEVTSLQTTLVSKSEQVEELQSWLEKKDEIVKELDSQVKEILQDGQWINDKFDNTISPNTCCCQWDFFVIKIFFNIMQHNHTITLNL